MYIRSSLLYASTSTLFVNSAITFNFLIADQISKTKTLLLIIISNDQRRVDLAAPSQDLSCGLSPLPPSAPCDPAFHPISLIRIPVVPSPFSCEVAKFRRFLFEIQLHSHSRRLRLHLDDFSAGYKLLFSA